MARTEIKTLGEFGLIRHLTRGFETRQPGTEYAVGDDCAVINVQKGAKDQKGVNAAKQRMLVTSDILLEGVHFNLEYVPMKMLGYKAVMVNLSDICAMNGTPTQVVISLGISARFSVEDMEQLYAGVKAACEKYDVDLVGGDTTASMTGLTISVTCLGVADADQIVYRNGAKVNDLICVSGNLGAAYMGLQLLERERLAGGNTDAFEGKEYILQRQLKPEARLDIVRKLRKLGIKPTAMMDVSDGLSSELLHICGQSQVGCAVYADKLPIEYQSAAMAEELNMDIVTCALNGGEDYELLFTIDQKDYEKIIELEDVHVIGYICRPELGCNLVGRNGEEIALRAQGFNAFTE